MIGKCAEIVGWLERSGRKGKGLYPDGKGPLYIGVDIHVKIKVEESKFVQMHQISQSAFPCSNILERVLSHVEAQKEGVTMDITENKSSPVFHPNAFRTGWDKTHVILDFGIHNPDESTATADESLDESKVSTLASLYIDPMQLPYIIKGLIAAGLQYQIQNGVDIGFDEMLSDWEGDLGE